MSVSVVDAVDADRSSRLAKTAIEKNLDESLDRIDASSRAAEVDRGGRRATGGGPRLARRERPTLFPAFRRSFDARDDGAAEGTQSPRTFRGGGADRPRRARAAHAHRDPVAAGAPDVPAGQRRDARAPRALGPGARDGRDARRGGGEREHRGRCTARHEVVRREGRRAMRQRERGDYPPLSWPLHTAPGKIWWRDKPCENSVCDFFNSRPPINDSRQTPSIQEDGFVARSLAKRRNYVRNG